VLIHKSGLIAYLTIYLEKFESGISALMFAAFRIIDWSALEGQRRSATLENLLFLLFPS
jgi:hypothetical protein